MLADYISKVFGNGLFDQWWLGRGEKLARLIMQEPSYALSTSKTQIS